MRSRRLRRPRRDGTVTQEEKKMREELIELLSKQEKLNDTRKLIVKDLIEIQNRIVELQSELNPTWMDKINKNIVKPLSPHVKTVGKGLWHAGEYVGKGAYSGGKYVYDNRQHIKKSVKEGISRSVKYLREHKDSLRAWLKGERARK
jgi:hypothetical protein